MQQYQTKVKMLETQSGSPDGRHTHWYQKGLVYDIPSKLAEIFVSKCWAEQLPPEARYGTAAEGQLQTMEVRMLRDAPVAVGGINTRWFRGGQIYRVGLQLGEGMIRDAMAERVEREKPPVAQAKKEYAAPPVEYQARENREARRSRTQALRR